MTLTEFLLARIAEDEALAKAAIDLDRPGTHWHWVRSADDVPVDDPADDHTDEFAYGLRTVEHFPTTSGVGDLPAFVLREVFPSESLGHLHIARHDPARVLAECEAKRRIVERHGTHPGVVPTPFPVHQLEYRGGCGTLRYLAAVYADHPDYDKAWRP